MYLVPILAWEHGISPLHTVTHFTGVPTFHLSLVSKDVPGISPLHTTPCGDQLHWCTYFPSYSLGSKDVLGITKLFTLWNAKKPRWFIERSMMQSWESYNKIQWSSHNLFVDMCVARAPWHVLVDGWEWWGRGGGQRMGRRTGENKAGSHTLGSTR